MRFALWGALALLLTTAAPAATVLRLEAGAMAERSSLIFIGTVAGQRSVMRTTPRQVVTLTRFAVDEVLKGSLDGKAGGQPEGAQTFTLSQLGGTVDGYTTHVPGYARFAVGERVMLFLERADTGRLVVTGLSQGKYTLTTDAKSGVVIAQRGLDGLHQVGNRPDKVFANVPANADRMTLGQLLNLVVDRQPPSFAPPKVLRRRTRQVVLPGGDQ